jgi:hypothetical protein
MSAQLEVSNSAVGMPALRSGAPAVPIVITGTDAVHLSCLFTKRASLGVRFRAPLTFRCSVRPTCDGGARLGFVELASPLHVLGRPDPTRRQGRGAQFGNEPVTLLACVHTIVFRSDSWRLDFAQVTAMSIAAPSRCLNKTRALTTVRQNQGSSGALVFADLCQTIRAPRQTGVVRAQSRGGQLGLRLYTRQRRPMIPTPSRSLPGPHWSSDSARIPIRPRRSRCGRTGDPRPSFRPSTANHGKTNWRGREAATCCNATVTCGYAQGSALPPSYI